MKGALYSRFVKVRQTYETLYGSHRGFPVLAVSGRTPRHATGLVAQVRETAGFLAQPRVELPRLDVAGITVDPPATAVQLAAGAAELDGVLGDLDAALKLAEVTRAAKNDALTAYDATFLRVARVAESLFHFAGLHEHALRVRPSARRPGRRLADEGAEPSSGDTAAQQATGETRDEPKGPRERSVARPGRTTSSSSKSQAPTSLPPPIAPRRPPAPRAAGRSRALDQPAGLAGGGPIAEEAGAVQLDVGLVERHRAALGDRPGFVEVAAGAVAVSDQGAQPGAGEQTARELIQRGAAITPCAPAPGDSGTRPGDA